MAVTLIEVKRWLDNLEIGYQESQKQESIILFGFQGKNESTYGVKIELEEDGELLQIYCNLLIDEDQNILKIKDHEHKALVLQHILNINYNEKFGAWEFDPSDGEIRFAVEIPLEDAKMTEKQFKRIFGHIMSSDERFLEILKIMETGELPEGNITDDLFASLMAEMLAEKLHKDLEAHGGDVDSLLASLQNDTNSKKDDEDGI
jgi:hypothetical protein